MLWCAVCMLCAYVSCLGSMDHMLRPAPTPVPLPCERDGKFLVCEALSSSVPACDKRKNSGLLKLHRFRLSAPCNHTKGGTLAEVLWKPTGLLTPLVYPLDAPSD